MCNLCRGVKTKTTHTHVHTHSHKHTHNSRTHKKKHTQSGIWGISFYLNQLVNPKQLQRRWRGQASNIFFVSFFFAQAFFAISSHHYINHTHAHIYVFLAIIGVGDSWSNRSHGPKMGKFLTKQKKKNKYNTRSMLVLLAVMEVVFHCVRVGARLFVYVCVCVRAWKSCVRIECSSHISCKACTLHTPNQATRVCLIYIYLLEFICHSTKQYSHTRTHTRTHTHTGRHKHKLYALFETFISGDVRVCVYVCVCICVCVSVTVLGYIVIECWTFCCKNFLSICSIFTLTYTHAHSYAHTHARIHTHTHIQMAYTNSLSVISNWLLKSARH